MDALDEKVNGGPPMEVEEIVSVTDRAYPYLPCLALDLIASVACLRR